MNSFSSQYMITNAGSMLTRAIVSAEEDGKIVSVDDTGGKLKERHSVEFHNGIIIPGFVNCHSHLELSHMKGEIARGKGLGSFIEEIRTTRHSSDEKIALCASSADMEMYRNGISLCADVCNTSKTFSIKKLSRINYINLIEVFGIDPDRALGRMDEMFRVGLEASEMNLPFSFIPHSLYSMSITLLRLLREETEDNKISSVHFMETPGEQDFLANHSGVLLDSYKRTGLIPSRLETVKNHTDAVLHELTRSGNMILVHNTFADAGTIRRLAIRKNLFWCLCPNSNLYIENTIPPVNLLMQEGCEIVIGTDSLASNNKLDILSELITLQLKYPFLSITDLVGWATINGAKALGMESSYGKIEPGKNPGLLLLQNVDLQNMKLLPDSFVTRLI